MKSDKKTLAPTIWRTVRAVMNPIRLNLLRAVMFSDGTEYTVSDLARKFGIDQPIATIYLRQLNARGLLGVRRGRIKVFYNAEQDRSLPDSIEIQETLAQCMKEKSDDGWEVELLTILKAFSHFNRLAMLTRLAEGPASLKELNEAVGCSVKSIYHHLRFLHLAGLVEGIGGNRAPTIFSLTPPTHRLARTLLKITLRNQVRFAKYWNQPLPTDEDAATKSVLRKISRAEGNNSHVPRIKGNRDHASSAEGNPSHAFCTDGNRSHTSYPDGNNGYAPWRKSKEKIATFSPNAKSALADIEDDD